MATRWSDDGFLDEIRRHVDTQADGCVARLFAEGGGSGSALLFRHATSNDDQLPQGSPRALARSSPRAAALPPDIDTARTARGELVWIRTPSTAALVLLAKSLPEGYAAKSFGEMLSMSADLERHPYRRLLGVLQMVVNVASPGGFTAKGKTINTAQKMRLMHAAIRTHVLRAHRAAVRRGALRAAVNHEDMLATVMGFSYVVIEGLAHPRRRPRARRGRGPLLSWRTFARMVGIHPEGHPDSDEWVPGNVAEAAEFYAAFKKRHYVGPATTRRASCSPATTCRCSWSWSRAAGVSSGSGSRRASTCRT